MLHSSFTVNKSRNTHEAVAVELGIRPLNARSIALSALLGSHPPELPVAAIVELGDLFGIAPGTMRTALSRLVSAGEVAADDGRYRLAGRLLDRQREQDVGRTDADRSWHGDWWSATVVTDRRSMADRRRFRSAMAGARMGELRPEQWMRPANIDVQLDLPDVTVIVGPMTAGDPLELTRRLWDVGALERRAAELHDALRRSADSLREADSTVVAPAFTTLAACLQYLRSEPQLPVELSPSPAARALRSAYGPTEDILQGRLREVYRRGISTGVR